MPTFICFYSHVFSDVHLLSSNWHRLTSHNIHAYRWKPGEQSLMFHQKPLSSGLEAQLNNKFVTPKTLWLQILVVMCMDWNVRCIVENNPKINTMKLKYWDFQGDCPKPRRNLCVSLQSDLKVQCQHGYGTKWGEWWVLAFCERLTL